MCNNLQKTVGGSYEAPKRPGMTLWELLGCIVAVVVGVWLGARFLGTDLQTLTYSTLSETEVLDKLPPHWRPPAPEGMEPPTSEELAAQLEHELAVIQEEIGLLDQGHPPLDGEFPGTLTPEERETLAQYRDASLQYWTKLEEIYLKVNQLQHSATEALNNTNVWKVMDLRRRAYRYGEQAIEAIAAEGVDPRVLQLGEQYAAWYQHGGKLYAEAINVWQSQHLSSQGLTSDQVLAKARRQHENESTLLYYKSERLGKLLTRYYNGEFLPIGPPPAGE